MQVFEVDTATMMSAPGAIKPVHQLMQEAGEKFDPKAYVSAVAGYYTDRKGRMLSMPFNSSTTVFYVNKDAFRKTGLDPNKAPTTWKEFGITAGKLKASGQSCVYTTGWPSWVHAENFSAWHNLPLSGTTIAALFVIQFIYGWNQYLWPLLITTREDMYTTVIGIRRMIVGGDALTEWPLVMATAMLAMLPPALVVLVMQKWFVQGLVDSEK